MDIIAFRTTPKGKTRRVLRGMKKKKKILSYEMNRTNKGLDNNHASFQITLPNEILLYLNVYKAHGIFESVTIASRTSRTLSLLTSEDCTPRNIGKHIYKWIKEIIDGFEQESKIFTHMRQAILEKKTKIKSIARPTADEDIQHAIDAWLRYPHHKGRIPVQYKASIDAQWRHINLHPEIPSIFYRSDEINLTSPIKDHERICLAYRRGEILHIYKDDILHKQRAA